jgi:hypothetical protein
MVTEGTILLSSDATYTTRCLPVLLRRYVMCYIHSVQEDGALWDPTLCIIRSGVSLLCVAADSGSQLCLFRHITSQMERYCTSSSLFRCQQDLKYKT